MTENQRRSARLVQNIRAALERGVRADRIHAELVRRNMPPEKATLLLDRILWSMMHSAGAQPLPDASPAGASRPHPAPRPAAAPASPAQPATPSDASAHTRRRTRAPFFLALAVLLMTGGFAGVFLNRQEAEARRDRQAAELARLAERLETEIVSARAHLDFLDGRIEERRVDAEQVEWLRARIARGPASFATREDYTEMVARYHRRRERWNRTLPEYQVVAQAFRTLADIHNTKVDSLEALRPGLPSAARGVEEGTIRRVRVATVAGSM